MKFLPSTNSQTENTSTPPATSVTAESEENNDGNNAMNSEATEQRGEGEELRDDGGEMIAMNNEESEQ